MVVVVDAAVGCIYADEETVGFFESGAALLVSLVVGF